MSKENLFIERIKKNIFYPLMLQTTREKYDSLVVYVCKILLFDHNKIKYPYQPDGKTIFYSYKTLNNITKNNFKKTIKLLILLYKLKNEIDFDLEWEINKCIEYSIDLDWFNPGIQIESWKIIYNNKEYNNILLRSTEQKIIKKIYTIEESINKHNIIFYKNFEDLQINNKLLKISEIVKEDINLKKWIVLLYTILKEWPKLDINDYMSYYKEYNKGNFNWKYTKNLKDLRDAKSRLKKLGNKLWFKLIKNKEWFFDISLTD